MTKQQDDKEKEVTITLKKWQVEKLLGAARTGTWLEYWCSNFWFSLTNTFDTHSLKWNVAVNGAIDEIKHQTEIDYEDKAYGAETRVVEAIAEMVAAQCKEFEKGTSGNREKVEEKQQK